MELKGTFLASGSIVRAVNKLIDEKMLRKTPEEFFSMHLGDMVRAFAAEMQHFSASVHLDVEAQVSGTPGV